MTNNEILNAIHENGQIGILPVEQRKTWEGKAYTYLSDVSLTANTASYFGIITNENPVHLESLGIVTKDDNVTVEISETPTFNGGTEVYPIAKNRKTKLASHRDEFSTMSFNTATALKHQPLVGEPVIRRVINNENILYPEVAVSITNVCGDYGLKVEPVAQVDASQGLKIHYKSKQVRSVNKSETITIYTVGVPITLAHQSYDGKAPVISTVYNNTIVPLSLTIDYTITKDEVEGWQITILDESTTVDPAKNIIISYIIEEEYNAEFVQEEKPFEFDCATLTIDTPSGTFVDGEFVNGGTSNAIGVIVKIEDSSMYLTNVEGEFANGETITGQDSSATADLTANGEPWHFVLLEEQSYDDSEPSLVSVENGTRNSIVEYLSLTQDYTFALDTTYKITLKDTAKTSATKPVIVLYQIEELAYKGDGTKLYTGPTVSDQGTIIDRYVIPSASNVGDNWETILRPETKYLVKIISSKSQNVLVRYRWYLE